MKTIQIIILSLLIATQSFAWGQAEQKALLGFTAGVALTHFISNYDNSRTYEPKEETQYIDARYERYSEVHHRRPHRKNRTVYVNNYYNTTYYNERPREQKHCRSNRVIVNNTYRNDYYY